MAGKQSTENMPVCWDRYLDNYMGRVQSQGETSLLTCGEIKVMSNRHLFEWIHYLIPMHIEIESS